MLDHSNFVSIAEFVKREMFGLKDMIKNWRRELHQIPEIGLELPKTTEYLKQELHKMGIYPTLIGRGLTVDIGTAGTQIFAIRADMDALPMQEHSQTNYMSKHINSMHACGHDAHMAILLGIIYHFVQHPPNFKMRFIFQAGEEGYFGANKMLAEGALQGVTAIIGVHVGALSSKTLTGMAGIQAGPLMAATDEFTLEFHGVGAHAAMPHFGKDPILAACEFTTGIQSIRLREIDPFNPTMISVNMIHGGTAHNIIPPSIELKGTVRTLNEIDREFIIRRIQEYAAGIATAHGLTHTFNFISGYPVLTNTEDITELVRNSAEAILGKDNVTLPGATLGGEDFAYYLHKIPGCFWFFCTNNSDKGIIYPNHNPKFDVDDDIIWKAAAVNVLSAYHYKDSYHE